ncbi:MAG: cytidine deaminase [Pirellulales bacterium]
MIDPSLINSLIARARAAAEASYSPYSRFPVGAAVLTANGNIYAAPNVENASYGLTICAERNAMFHAIAASERRIVAIALFTPTDSVYTPCGACRQVISEFADHDSIVLCVTNNGRYEQFTMAELLPHGFRL